jgi:hypothetical protein
MKKPRTMASIRRAFVRACRAAGAPTIAAARAQQRADDAGWQQINTEAGRLAYESDCARKPRYHDGAPRKTWEQLGEIEKASWSPRAEP